MNAIDNFGAYRKAIELFDHVVEDLSEQSLSAGPRDSTFREEPIPYETRLSTLDPLQP